ncbi:hypothetical protein NW757_012328 [Fusarium falciforme]|nr:hypothetical protein NW757_012328 [Fusarium falciforme]
MERVVRVLKTAATALKSAGHIVTEVTTPVGGDYKTVLETYLRGLALDSNNSAMKPMSDGNEEVLPALTEIVEALGTLPPPTLGAVWDYNASKTRIRKAWLYAMSKDNLDIILCPGAGSPGFLHDTFGMPFYTMIWNLLDVPASVVPYLKADKTIDVSEMEGYDPELTDGIPCGIQLVGWSGQDEEVLMATEVVADVLHEAGQA